MKALGNFYYDQINVFGKSLGIGKNAESLSRKEYRAFHEMMMRNPMLRKTEFDPVKSFEAFISLTPKDLAIS